jgi:hypothetical protein
MEERFYADVFFMQKTQPGRSGHADKAVQIIHANQRESQQPDASRQSEE